MHVRVAFASFLLCCPLMCSGQKHALSPIVGSNVIIVKGLYVGGGQQQR